MVKIDDHSKIKKATYHLYLFMVSKLISSFGSQVFAFIISFYILQLTGSATSFATNLICNILPRTVVAPFAGIIIDRSSRKAIVIISQIATTITVGLLLTITLTSGLSLLSIYVTTCILSLTSMFSGIAFSSSITGLIDKDRIQKAMSLNQMSISFSAIASPAIGGLLYGTVSIIIFLVFFIATSSIAVILESTMNFKLFSNQSNIVEAKRKESIGKSIVSALNYLKIKPIVQTMMLIGLLVNFLFGAFEVGYSYILIEKMEMSSVYFGFTKGAFSIGMLLISIYFSIRKEVNFPLLVTKRGILAMGTMMVFVALPLLITFPDTLVFIYYSIVMFFLGSIIMIINTPLQVMLQKNIDDEFKGRVFSIIETTTMSLIPLGMVLYGFLYDIFPGQWILLLSAGLLIAVILIIARPAVLRQVHHQISLKEWDKRDKSSL